MEITGKLVSCENKNSEYCRACHNCTTEATIKLSEVNRDTINPGDTIWVEKIVSENELLKHFLNRYDKIVAHFPKPEPKESEKDLRNKIADVIEKDLPWTEEDLLGLADKIIAVLPKPEPMPIVGGRVPDCSCHTKDDKICMVHGITPQDFSANVNKKVELPEKCSSIKFTGDYAIEAIKDKIDEVIDYLRAKEGR